jgi:hypothetical protein
VGGLTEVESERREAEVLAGEVVSWSVGEEDRDREAEAVGDI